MIHKILLDRFQAEFPHAVNQGVPGDTKITGSTTLIPFISLQRSAYQVTLQSF
jgi:hypothetical protein